MSEHSVGREMNLELFDLVGDQIESDLPQQAVDGFAADFQALRHFGERLAQAFNLGGVRVAALQEDENTVMYSLESDLGVAGVAGRGGRVSARVLLKDLLATVDANP